MPSSYRDRIAAAMTNQACTADLLRTIPQAPAPPHDDRVYLARVERTARNIGRLALADWVMRPSALRSDRVP